MSGFNMPPGVSSNMIPGNRTEDAAAEAAEEALFNAFYKAHRANFSLKEMGEVEASAAEEAYHDEQDEARLENEMDGDIEMDEARNIRRGFGEGLGFAHREKLD